MSSQSKLSALLLAASLLFICAIAKAGDQTAAQIALLKQIATQGQDPKTAAQVNQYIDQNKATISAILKMYQQQIQQARNPSTDPNPPAPDAAGTAAPSSTPQPQAQPAQPSTQASSSLQPSTGLQPSSGLQTSEVQPSTGLQTSHLAGYPSLPDVDPTTSVTQMSAAQAAQAAYALKIEKENAARKASLMAQPQGYDY